MPESEWEMAHLVTAITKDNEEAAAARAEQAKVHAIYRREFALEYAVKTMEFYVAMEGATISKAVSKEIIDVARDYEDYLLNG